MTRTFSILDISWRVAISATLIATGVAHTQLYERGYRYIEYIGPSFLIQAAAAFALAALVPFGPLTLTAAAALLGVASLGGFALSRTTGLFGFTEIGWDPAPQALISVMVEALTVLLCVTLLYRASRSARR